MFDDLLSFNYISFNSFTCVFKSFFVEAFLFRTGFKTGSIFHFSKLMLDPNATYKLCIRTGSGFKTRSVKTDLGPDLPRLHPGSDLFASLSITTQDNLQKILFIHLSLSHEQEATCFLPACVRTPPYLRTIKASTGRSSSPSPSTFGTLTHFSGFS